MIKSVEGARQTIFIALNGYDDVFVSSEMTKAQAVCLLGTTRDTVESRAGAHLNPTASLNDALPVSDTTQLIISDGYEQSVSVYIDPRIKSLVLRVLAAGGTVKAAPKAARQLGRLGIYLPPDRIIYCGQFELGKLEST